MQPPNTVYKIHRGAGGIVNLFRDSPQSSRNSTWTCQMIAPAASQQLYNHSPDGFEFGYGGSGPAQLALAILLDCTGSNELALRHYQDFKWRFVARWKGNHAEITAAAIADFLHEQEEAGAAFIDKKGDHSAT